MLLAISGFLTMMGFFIPFMFITDRAIQGTLMDPKLATYIVSAIGLSNTVARIFCGLIGSLNVDALHLNNVFITLGGVFTIFSGYSLVAGYQFAYAAVFGVAIGEDYFLQLYNN